MRFSVDAHAIGRHLTGNEVYIRNLLNGFAALDGSSDFTAYISVEDTAAWVPERFQRCMISQNPYLRLGYDLSGKLRQEMPDLVHVQYTAPLNCPVPIVVSVHDVSFLEHSEFFPWPRAFQLKHTVKHTVQKAAKILTPSEYSRSSIMKAYNLDEDSIVAIPNAVSSEFRQCSREQAISKIETRFSIPSPFILNVGDLQPRKNQEGLIKAFAELIRCYPDLPHHLVFVGQQGWQGSRVRKAADKSGLSERIHFTDFVSDDDLLQFYNACEIFAFPSLFEGFGLPILEAMACGRAVACSNTTAMPEVADAAAILFDPNSVEEITRAMRDLVLDPELRTHVERLGLRRAARFNWASTAQKTLDIYYEIADSKQQTESLKTKSVLVSHP